MGSCKPPAQFSPLLGMLCHFRQWSCLPRGPAPPREALLPILPEYLEQGDMHPHRNRMLVGLHRIPPLLGASEIRQRGIRLPSWTQMHNGASRHLASGFDDWFRPKSMRISCEPTVDIKSLTSYTYRPIRWPLGEIGRHARLRILCREASGFDSPSGHCKVLPGVQFSQNDWLATAGSLTEPDSICPLPRLAC